MYIRDYRRPASVSEAVAELSRADARVAPLMLGPRVRYDSLTAREVALDLSELRLDGIVETEDELRVGALVTLQALIDHSGVQLLANGILSHAAHLAAHRGLRHVAAVGGALLDTEGPAEITLAFLALDAVAIAQGAGVRETPLADYRPAPAELLCELRLPRPESSCGGALARVARSPLDSAIVAAVAVVSAQTARVAVSGAGPAPIVKAGADRDGLLAAVAAAARAQAVGDYRGSAGYRTAMAEVLARRALDEAAQRRARR